VGVAASPRPDPSLKGDLHEIYIGLPEYNNEGFKKSDNSPIAANLQGKLLVIHGTSDPACRTSHQMHLAEALIRAGKFFDLIMLPERGHGLNYSDSPQTEFIKERLYSFEATKRYFVEHLKPDLNQ
jgi:dipeptidyl aminopeptidase/acylaminoacyl peptidase